MLRKKKIENTEEIVPQAVYFTSEEKIEGEDSAEDLSSKKKKPLMEILGLIEKIESSQEITANPMETEEEEKEYENVAENINQVTTVTESIQVDNNAQNTEEIYQEKLDINDIYLKFGPSTDSTNTIYIIDSYLKALPDNLPSDIKLQSVLSIVAASKMDIDQLLNDGSKRVEVLAQFFKNFMNYNNNIIDENEKEITILTEKINHHKKIIEGRKKLQEDQKSAVEFELQKIQNIIDFAQSKKL